MEKPRTSEYFPKRKDSKDGFRNECKECIHIIKKQYRESNKEQNKEYMANYYQKNKDLMLNKAKKYYSENKRKVIQYQRAHYAENREYILARQSDYMSDRKEEKCKYDKIYRVKNYEKISERRKLNLVKNRPLKRISNQRRRTRMKSLPSTLTMNEWLETLSHFDNKCCYCSSEHDVLQQDHFIPLSKGGGYTKENIVPACPSCNQSKNDRDFSEWYEKQGFYSIEVKQKILNFIVRHETRR